MVVEVVDEMGDVVLALFGMAVKIVSDAANEFYGANCANAPYNRRPDYWVADVRRCPCGK